MVKPRYLRAGAVAAAAGLIFGMTACSSSGDSGDGGVTELSLAATMELSGAAATTGNVWAKGVELGVKEANGTDGFTVDGKQYKWNLDMTDNQSEADKSIADYRDFVGNGDKFYIGPTLSSSFTPAFNSLGNAEALVMVAGGVPEGTVIKDNQSVFTTLSNAQPSFNDAYAQAVVDAEKPKTAAILLPQDYSGSLFVQQFGDFFKSAGVEVVLEKQFPPDTTNFAPYVNNLVQANPDIVLTGYLDSWVQPLMDQAINAGFTSANWMMTVGDTVPVLSTFATESGPIETIYNPVPVKSVTNPDDTQLETFRSLWKEEYGAEPEFNDFNALAYYDPVLMLTQALQDAGTVDDLARISAALLKVQTWQGQASDGGYDLDTLTRDYPVNYITISGGKIDYFQVPAAK